MYAPARAEPPPWPEHLVGKAAECTDCPEAPGEAEAFVSSAMDSASDLPGRTRSGAARGGRRKSVELTVRSESIKGHGNARAAPAKMAQKTAVYPSPLEAKPAPGSQPYGRVPQNAKFPGKLRTILKDPRFSTAIRWDEELRGIVLLDPERIAREVLPEYFTAQASGKDIFKSFRRQLIYYGFEDVSYKRGVCASIPGANPPTRSVVSVCVNRDPNIRTLDDFDHVLRYVPPRKPKGDATTTRSKKQKVQKQPSPAEDSASEVSCDDTESGSSLSLRRVSDDASSRSRDHLANNDSSHNDSLDCRCYECTKDESVAGYTSHSVACDHEDRQQERVCTLVRRPTSLQARHKALVAKLLEAEAAKATALAEANRLRDEIRKLRADNSRLRKLAGIRAPLCQLCHERDALSDRHARSTCDACASHVRLLLAFSCPHKRSAHPTFSNQVPNKKATLI